MKDYASTSKIKSVEEATALAASWRGQGLSVVMAHGVFDLLHLGHLHHLQEGRRQGDRLIVSLTADAFVNKGPGRPAFPSLQRAEMVAALSCVDAAVISENPTAIPMIKTLMPDVYLKGSDYRNAEDDVTGNITRERDAVEAHGGRLGFTDEVTFSSTTLINRYMNVDDTPLNVYLRELRQEGGLEKLAEYVDKIADMKVLFVGDTIIDEYRYIKPLGKTPKDSIIACLDEDDETFAGGVIAAANHLAGFCDNVDILTTLGPADSYEGLVREHLRPNVNLDVVWHQEGPTTRKTRFIDRYNMRKMFEVYTMDDSALSATRQADLDRRLAERVGDYDLIVLTDFGHGMIQQSTIDLLMEKAPYLAVNAQTNSGNFGFNLITKYRRADFVSIDHNEAMLAIRDKNVPIRETVGKRLPALIDCPRIIVTNGKFGSVGFERGAGLVEAPALTSTIVDNVGAGDAFFALSAPLAAMGASMKYVSLIGNMAGAMKVGIVGHRTSVEKSGLIKFATSLLK